MPSLKLPLLTHTLASLLLIHLTHAQNSEHCPILTPTLQHNASSTLTIPALYLSYLGDEAGNVRIQNEIDFSWTLSSYIQPRSNAVSESNDTQTVVWLDTAESNTTRLGQTMRMCHNFVPLQVGPNATWSHATLEKSVSDTGDCRTMVSEACLKRLETQYLNNAAAERNEYTACGDTNTTVPWECVGSGMVEPVSRPSPAFNGSLADRFPMLSNSSVSLLNGTDPLVCDGHNFSREFDTFAAVQDYDIGTNFPLMDIMTFFPTVQPGRVSRGDMQRVQIACLVPGQITEGSRERASVQSVLGRYNSTGGNQTAGAKGLGRVEVWKLVAWVIGVGFVCVV